MIWSEWAVTFAVFLPLLGAVVVAAIPKHYSEAVRPTVLAFAAAGFVISMVIALGYDVDVAGVQYEADVMWIEPVNARYHVGLDGVSLPLFVLSYLLTLLCSIYAFGPLEGTGDPKAFLSLMLLLQTGVAGTFVSFDLLLFFVFWEFVLVPMYFMIGAWGGPNRNYAALKFFLYTLVGSVFMLIGFLALRFTVGTFDVFQLAEAAHSGRVSAGVQSWVLAAVFLGFAVKVPVWPFHTWLPDAHTEAPTIGSVLLAGVLLKMGGYGLIRIAVPVLPDAATMFAPVLAVLSMIAIIYGALLCLAQTELKRLIAYSSIGHMGFVTLAISTLTVIGVNAALYAMVAHGVITGLLFFVVGAIKRRYHTDDIAEIGGGVLQRAPRLGVVLTFVTVASLGLPGLAGFPGEFMTLLSTFRPSSALVEAGHTTLYRTVMVFAGLGMVLTAGYFLHMLQRVTMGESSERWDNERIDDVTQTEWLAWTPLLILTVVFGVVPAVILRVTTADVNALMALFN